MTEVFKLKGVLETGGPFPLVGPYESKNVLGSSRPVGRKDDSCISLGGVSASRNGGWEQLIKYLTQHTWN